MGEAGAAGCTDILNLDVTNRGPASDADVYNIHYEARIVFFCRNAAY